MFSINRDPFEGLILLDNFANLRFDALELFGADAMIEFEVIVKAVLYRWPSSELSFGLNPQDRRSQHMGGRVSQPLQIGHRRCFLVAHRRDLNLHVTPGKTRRFFDKRLLV